MLTLHKITPAKQKQPLKENIIFSIILDASSAIENDIELLVIYVGSANTDEYDQIICSNMIGPIPKGRVQFSLECDPIKINIERVFGVTSVVVVGKYNGNEFMRIGYFVRVEYPNIDIKELENEELNEIEDIEEEIREDENDDEIEDEIDEGYVEGESTENGSDENQSENSNDLSNENDESEEAESTESEQKKETNAIDSKKEIKDNNIDIDATNATINILQDITLQMIKETNDKNEPNDLIENNEKIDEEDKNDIINMIENNDVCEYKGYKIEKEKITIEFCEPPLITFYSIKWDNQDEEINEECIEDEIDEEISESDEQSEGTLTEDETIENKDSKNCGFEKSAKKRKIENESVSNEEQ